jgi:8-oxo-dGTP pyrophosphatase MutT (NUDIX family)
MMERWDLYDEHRKPLRKLHTRGIDLGAGEYHTVVEIFTVNADGRLLLTQRDPLKTYPFLWEGTGGSVTAGETSLEGAQRELQEETGLNVLAEELAKIGGMRHDTCFRDIYIWRSPDLIDIADLNLQPDEVCAAKWVTFHELKEMNRLGLIVPTVWNRILMYEKEIDGWMRCKDGF